MKNAAFETIEYLGYSIDLFYDTDPQSPDEWANDDCFLVYDHRDFTVKRKGFDGQEIFELYQAGKSLFAGYWIFPVHAYIHSGVSLSLARNSYPFTDPWDTSFKGFALVKRQKGWTYTRDKAQKIAQSIVNEWNQYLGGEVYGYNSPAGSCWGFYGDEGKKQMIEEAKGEIEYLVKEKIKSHFSQLKTWIRNRVPYSHRKALTELWEGSLPIMA